MKTINKVTFTISGMDRDGYHCSLSMECEVESPEDARGPFMELMAWAKENKLIPIAKPKQESPDSNVRDTPDRVGRPNPMYRIVKDRIATTPELREHEDTLLGNVPTDLFGHWFWIATAPVEEIKDWAIAKERGER